MRTSVYVDGYNLYYGLLKEVPNRKWLNLVKLAQTLRPGETIVKVRYFTAMVKSQRDPQEPQRQQMYIRALGTLPEVTIQLGQFRSHEVKMPLANPPAYGPAFATVIKTEEKGSDVNLATALLCDAVDDLYDTAIVISNDSDLASPIHKVKTKFKKKIGVYSTRDTVTFDLRKVATFYRTIDPVHIESSQFPGTLSDHKGDFHKPPHW